MEMRDRLIDTKEYAKQMRENAVTDENGIIRVSIELWEQIADIIERAIVPPCKVGDKENIVLPDAVNSIDASVFDCCSKEERSVRAMAEYVEREAVLELIREKWFYNSGQVFRELLDLPAADVVEIPQSGIGDLSDGYHTFNELYHHRAVLFSVICNLMPHRAWKSKLHDTGDMFEGMFIVGIETPQGQATYHYDIDPYWDMFRVKELEKAPKWDGHTPQEAIERLLSLSGVWCLGEWKDGAE